MGKSKNSSRKAKGDSQENQERKPAIAGVMPDAEVLTEQSGMGEVLVSALKSQKERAPKIRRDERNGVKRPGPGKCLEVWEYLDQCGDVEAKDLKLIAVERGWNANNAVIELYQWRKFNGITRAATK